jgi:hypothetical protein
VLRCGVRLTSYLLTLLGIVMIAVAPALVSVQPPAAWLLVGYGVTSIGTGIGVAIVARRRASKAAARARQIAAGLAGTAMITVVEPLQMSENSRCRIRMNVTLPGRLVYQAFVEQRIPRTDMPRYQPGSVFPVSVSPDDPSRMFLLDLTGVSWASSRTELAAAGLAGTAKVTGLFDPPVAAVTEPLWGLLLQVEVPDGRPAFELRLATVQPDGVTLPRQGDRIGRVWVDPDDPRNIAVDWASLVARPGRSGLRGGSSGRGGAGARRVHGASDRAGLVRR